LSIITPKTPTRIGLTITYARALEREMTSSAQYYYSRRQISKVIGSGSNNFCFMPEFMLNGRIHYHGWIDITNFVSWQRISLPSLKKIGRCKLEYNLTDKWYTYMYKSTDDTKKVLGFKSDISISVTVDDYKQWLKDNSEQPKLDKFNIKAKVLPSSASSKDITPPSFVSLSLD